MKPEQLKQAVKEFQEIYKSEYGKELSNSEATNKATSLLQLFEVLTSNRKEVLK